MAKKPKKGKGVKNFFFKTRLGFYVLVFGAIVGFTTTINSFNAANNASVLGEKSDQEEQKQEKEKRKEEEKQEKELRREENKQKIEEKYELNAEKLKLEYEFEDNNTKIKRKVEISNGKTEIEEEVEEDLADDIEEDFEDINEVSIASDDGNLVLRKNKVKARTGFPLSIDVNTGQLTITHPDGTTKNVAILPDQAVENFLRHKKVELIGTEPSDGGNGTSTDSAEPELDNLPGTDSTEQGFGIQSVGLVEELDETSNDQEIEVSIVERDDELVYEIKGKRKVKILGFIPSQTSTTGYVSTETGEVVGEDISLFDRFLNLISVQE